MNETEKNIWSVIKQHWFTLGGGLFLVFSIYTNDVAQTKQIQELDSRMQVLEHSRSEQDTKWAVLSVQLASIQTDLTDIKHQLKSK